MSSTPDVRVRVAPSPTGDPHVGTAYQALFNYCFARSRGGRFLLRIEDTDQARSTPESEAAILESLRWLGLTWDEGPDVGGPHGPYRQSERVAIHREHAEMLLAAGHAYRCFCTRERLDQMRLAQKETTRAGYDRHCREIDGGESARLAAAGEASVVRLKVPAEGTCVMQDLLRGEVRKEWSEIDDQVLLKSDGFPTYHLANVVDDHLMRISHVIRGEEWLASLPKHLLLYQCFGWEPPVFCHLPLLRNPDKSKLSKRKNPTSIHYYRRAGFLPQALRNYLAQMSFSMPGGKDKFTLDEMVAVFRLEDMVLGGPVFDLAKLRWLNGRYLREDLTPEALVAELKSWGLDDARLERIAGLAQPRLEVLSDWGALTAFFFAETVPLDVAELTLKERSADDLMAIFQAAIWELEKLRRFEATEIKPLFETLGEKFGVKLRDLTRPFYVAVSGQSASTPLFDSMAVLGNDLVRLRLRRAIEALGGIPAKRLKELEREHAARFGSRED